jgi:hypothetical protein
MLNRNYLDYHHPFQKANTSNRTHNACKQYFIHH